MIDALVLIVSSNYMAHLASYPDLDMAQVPILEPIYTQLPINSQIGNEREIVEQSVTSRQVCTSIILKFIVPLVIFCIFLVDTYLFIIGLMKRRPDGHKLEPGEYSSGYIVIMEFNFILGILYLVIFGIFGRSLVISKIMNGILLNEDNYSYHNDIKNLSSFNTLTWLFIYIKTGFVIVGVMVFHLHYAYLIVQSMYVTWHLICTIYLNVCLCTSGSTNSYTSSESDDD